jgi:hypothetical protein
MICVLVPHPWFTHPHNSWFIGHTINVAILQDVPFKMQPNNNHIIRYRTELEVDPLTWKIRMKVTLVARPLLRLIHQKRCRCEHVVFKSRMWAFILEHHFASKSLTAVHEAFSNARPYMEVPNKMTIRRLVIKFHGTGRVCPWQLLIELQNCWNYGSTASSSASAVRIQRRFGHLVRVEAHAF